MRFCSARRAPETREDRGLPRVIGPAPSQRALEGGWNIALLSDKWFLQNYRIRSESVTCTMLQGIDLDPAPAGSGRTFLVRSARLLLPGPLRRSTGRSSSRSFIPSSTTTSASTARSARRRSGGRPERHQSHPTEAAQFQQIPPQIDASSSLYETCAVFEARPVPRARSQRNEHPRLIGVPRGGANSSTTSGRSGHLSQICMGRRLLSSPMLGGLPEFRTPEFHRWRGPHAALRHAGRRAGDAVPVCREPRRDGVLQVIDRLSQVIVRPNETRVGRLPNEDAQSLIFDDTSIFEWDKFSGYDRVEGGTRANFGVQVHGHRRGMAFMPLRSSPNSYQLAGRTTPSVRETS